MFLNRFWEWFGDSIDDTGPLLPFFLIISCGGFIATINIGGYGMLLLLLIPFCLILGEWMFIDWIKEEEDKQSKTNIVFTKIGCWLGVIPLGLCLLVIGILYKQIGKFFLNTYNLILANYFQILTVIGTIAIIGFLVWGYFYLNILYVKRQGKLKKY